MRELGEVGFLVDMAQVEVRFCQNEACGLEDGGPVYTC